jgi:hypothetical protein
VLPAHNYTGGIYAAVSGVAPADHIRIENQINNQGETLAASLRPKGDWTIAVQWDSPTSTTGEVDAFVSCTEIAD